MPYRFVLASPYISCGRNQFEYYSDEADRGDVPNIVTDELRAKRFDSQEEAAKYVGNFMQAKEHMHEVIRHSLGRSDTQMVRQQDWSPIHIVPVE